MHVIPINYPICVAIFMRDGMNQLKMPFIKETDAAFTYRIIGRKCIDFPGNHDYNKKIFSFNHDGIWENQNVGFLKI